MSLPTKYKAKYKILRTKYIKKLASVGLVILVITGLTARFWPQSASAAWFDESFAYRQAVNITNSGSAVTNFQTVMTLDTATLISAGKMQANCNDIRITDSAGQQLPYWIETGSIGASGNACNGSATQIWTKVPSISTSGATLYVYYGNPSATSTQNGNQVFLFFDDFSTNTIGSKWTVQAGTWSVSNGVLEQSVSNTANLNIYANYSHSDVTVQARQKTITSSINDFTGINVRDQGDGTRYLVSWNDSASGNINVLKQTAVGETGSTWTTLGSGTYSSLPRTSFHTIKAKVGGTSLQGCVDASCTSVVTDSTFSSGTRVGLRSEGNNQFDWYFIRQYAATEPSTSQASEEKAPQPVAYWKFNEGFGTTTKDSTTNGNTGTLTNGPTWQTEDQCVSGKCLYFDGSNDYVQTTPISNLTTNFTVAMWVRPTVSGSWQTLYQSGTATNYWRINIDSNNKFDFTKNAVADYASTTAVTPNQWNYLEVVKSGDSGTNLTFYINGKVAGTASVGSVVTPSGTAYIGATGAPLLGFMDEPKIYPYARSATQVKADFNSRGGATAGGAVLSASGGSNNNAALSNGLVGYWKMDEASWNGTASEVRDASGNGNNGTATNGPTTGAGKFGNGGSFDGSNDYVTAPNSSSLSSFGTGGLTVSSWVYVTGQPSANFPSIIEKGSGDFSAGAGQGFNLMVPYLGGASYSNISWNVGSNAGNNTLYYTISAGAMTGRWMHVVGVADDQSIQNPKLSLYVDGVLVGTTSRTKTGSIDVAGNALNIGAWVATSRRFNGKIDELRLYNRALSSSEVSTLYTFAPGPVGYWNLDEKSGTTASDISGSGNTGTWNGTGNHFASGKVGGAGNFNGTNDYINTAGQYSYTQSQSFSVGAWIKTSTATAAGIESIVDKGYGYINTWGLIAGQNAGIRKAIFALNDGTVTPSASSTTAINDGRWHYISGVRDVLADKLYLYVDGKLEGSTTDTSTGDFTRSVTTLIGARPVSLAQYFGGQIDDVKIYNYARTQKQVAEDMMAGHPAVSGARTGSMVGYWKMDEGNGTVAKDSSGNNNNGTLTNMATAPSTSTSGWTNSGKFNKALNFDGSNDYVSGTLQNTPITTQFTLSYWVKPGVLGTQHNHLFLGTNGIARIVPYMTATNIFQCYSSSGAVINSGVTLSTSQWYQLACTYDGTTLKAYVNGVLKASGATSLTLTANAFTIGADASGTLPSRAALDEVKMYNYALSDTDMKLDYNRGASQQFGSTGTTAAGVNDNSSERSYCPPGDTTATCAPVGEWNFEDPSASSGQVADTSGNGLTGTWGGTGKHFVTGKIGRAGGFNASDDYVQISDASSIQNIFDTGGTIEAWVNPRSLGQNNLGRIVDKSSGASLGWTVFANSVSGNRMAITFRQAYSSGSNSWDTSTVIPLNSWSHVAITYNNSSTSNRPTIYVNGIPVTVSNTYGSGSGTRASDIGVNEVIGNVTGGSRAWDGSIDQVRIYNYARSAAQVSWDYNRGAPVAQYKMDECQGTIIHDSSGNRLDGTLTVGGAGTQTSAGTCQTSSTAWGNGAVGKINGSLNFDGTDDVVTVPHSSNIDFNASQSFTISTWAKFSSISNTYNFPYLVGKGTTFASAAGYGMYVFTTAGSSFNKVVFQIGDGTNSNGATSRSAMNDNQWHHYVGVVDRSSNLIKLYIDGSFNVQAGASSVGSPSNSSSLTIGKQPPSSFFPGQVDDVRIYNYALTTTQVKDLYNGGSVRIAPGTGTP